MHLYIVHIPRGGDAALAPAGTSSYKIADGLWAVGSADPTPADLMSELGIGQDLPGVIIKIDSYYGHFDQALWQKLTAWRMMP